MLRNMNSPKGQGDFNYKSIMGHVCSPYMFKEKAKNILNSNNTLPDSFDSVVINVK